MRPPHIAVFLATLMFISVLPATTGTEPDEPINTPPSCSADRVNWTMGVVFCNGNATTGYTLFAPMPGNTTYLIDHEGRWIHEWVSPGNHRPALSAYLLSDGSLLRTANTASTAVGNFSGGGTSGKLERISWDGTLEWSWEYNGATHISHHDIEPMPNGNILLIAWEERTQEESIQAGRNPEIASDSPGEEWHVWPDHIIEIEPVGNDDANIVWKWHAWDHLIQDYDPSKDNYGVVADHPERLNINYVGGSGNAAGRADWMHCNGIDYNADLDQIAISCRSMHEIYIIDHSTTIEEAAGHSGGRWGKGGDILYRWGNPQVYGKGLSSDQQLFGQHDVNWIQDGHPMAGALSIFNNGNGRYPSYSSVEIIVPPTVNDTYVLEENGTFGPSTSSWSWDMGEAMYSGSISGVDALSNGHLLVTHGTKGTLYEVDENGNVVWTYINPTGSNGAYNQSQTIPDGMRAGTTLNQIFKATHIPASHPSLNGRTLIPGDYLEHWTDLCPTEEAWGWDRNGDGCVDDTDGDAVLDPFDRCLLGDDNVDVDSDGVPDACDGFVDRDADGVEDALDICQGHDDAEDQDQDGIPDGCDPLIDDDGDGVGNNDDLCPGENDNQDNDSDGIPDACDDLIDSDGDGVADTMDICPNADDALDADQDGLPDACDTTPNGVTNASTTTNQTVNQSDEIDEETLDSSSLGRQTLLVLGLSVVLGTVGVVWLMLRQKRGERTVALNQVFVPVEEEDP